jgi:surfeit locus 1 family protein
MRLGALEFRLALWPTLVTVVFLVLLTSLGFWQLDRAEQKRVLLEQYNVDSSETVIRVDKNLNSVAGLEYQLAEARGQYDNQRQFLLDNRIYQGSAGYQVITPFMIAQDTAVLVNRGWVHLGVSRERLPDVHVQATERIIKGKLKPVNEKVFMLGQEEARLGWPYRVQHVNIKAFSEELGYTVLPFVMLLNPDESEGYVRDWRPLKFGPERNVGYAVQWFSLAAALLLIYLFVNTRKVK